MKRAILIGALLFAASAQATAQEFSSGATQTVMVELYTSEGCSSCPPAEQYLNGFVGNQMLWTRFIPMAWHVDYWDYLGWRDRFATAAHSSRQRAYARSLHAPTIYTPAFFINGQSWRPGFFNKLPDPPTRQVGALHVRLTGNRVEATFANKARDSQSLKIHVAVLGLGLKTHIRAGENAGRSALHDFVVLNDTVLDRKAASKWEGSLPTVSRDKAGRYALVAWVEAPGSPMPIQATGGYLSGLY